MRLAAELSAGGVRSEFNDLHRVPSVSFCLFNSLFGDSLSASAGINDVAF